MIKNIEITSFKSIKNLSLKAKKINIFIGEPNTGKSNILEALGFLSGLHYAGLSYDSHQLKHFVRFHTVVDLFYNQSVKEIIQIKTDTCSIKAKLEKNIFLIDFIDEKERTIQFKYEISGNIQGQIGGGSLLLGGPSTFSLSHIKYYLFKPLTQFNLENVSFLQPPFGENLSALAIANPEISEIMEGRFKEFGYDVLLKPYENKISILKKTKNVYVSLPYHLTSDSLQRIIFYMAAIKSNSSSVLVFEEPESNIFPYFVTMLAESIGLDKSDNQYFIATHNPYFLLSVLEKAPKDDINVFVTYLDESGTNVKCLTNKEIPELMEHDPFLNLNLFIDKDKE